MFDWNLNTSPKACMWHKSFRFGNFYRSEISKKFDFFSLWVYNGNNYSMGQNNVIKMRNCEEANHELKLTKNSLKVYRGHHSPLSTLMRNQSSRQSLVQNQWKH